MQSNVKKKQIRPKVSILLDCPFLSPLCEREQVFGEAVLSAPFGISGFSKPSWVTQNTRGKENTNQTSLLGCSCIAEKKKMCNVSCQLRFEGAK